MKNIAAFDAADYLDNDVVIAEYLNAALEDENPNVFLQAIADVAKARGMSQLAKDTGLGRESLYKALAPGAKPRYETGSRAGCRAAHRTGSRRWVVARWRRSDQTRLSSPRRTPGSILTLIPLEQIKADEQPSVVAKRFRRSPER